MAPARAAGLKDGFRSGFEKFLADAIASRGFVKTGADGVLATDSGSAKGGAKEQRLPRELYTGVFGYELESFRLAIPVRGHRCELCSSGAKIVRIVSYTPDFFFPTGWIVEAKGKFTPKDRKLALAFREQYPDRKYGLVFQRDNYLTKKHTLRYSEWASKNGIAWAVGGFKQEWTG
jgi:hypothetical protein